MTPSHDNQTRPVADEASIDDSKVRGRRFPITAAGGIVVVNR